MASDWSAALSERLSAPAAHSPASHSASPGIWHSLNQGLNLALYQPRASPDVIERELKGRQGAYFVLKNTRQKTYQRLTAQEHSLWQRMDGQASVQELIVEYFMANGVFAHQQVARLVQSLGENGMLEEAPIQVWQALIAKLASRSWLARLSAPAEFILTRRLSIKGLDGALTLLYKYFGWLFFTRPAQILFIAISAFGLLAYWQVLANPDYRFFQESLLLSLAALWLAAILPVVIHELGHALTVKHYGREVPRGGLMLYFGMPAAFVETTDIWLEPRRARLATTWNGPYTNLVIGGMAALLLFLFPVNPLNQFLFGMAGIAYFLVLLNVNPFLKLDGYYLLSDALEIPALRERSLAFIQRQLPNKIIRREKFRREEIIFLAFGLLSLAWTAYALYLAVFFWQARLGSALSSLLGQNVPLAVRLLSLLLLAALVSFAFLLALQLIRLGGSLLARFTRSGMLARHGRLALIGGGAALVLAWVIPWAFPRSAWFVASLIGGLAFAYASLRLFAFSRTYGSSRRGWGFAAFALATFLVGIAQIAHINSALIESAYWSLVAALGVLLGGFILLGWPTSPGQDLAWLLAGIGVAGAWWLAAGQSAQVDGKEALYWLAGVVSFAGVWAAGCLRGGGRMPAILLLTLGATAAGLSWFLSPRWDSLSLAAVLLFSAAGLHLVYARLPELSALAVERPHETQHVIGVSVSSIARRVLAQVFFEAGHAGASRLGQDFSRAMQNARLDISIEANLFRDRELPRRSVDQLVEVYGLVFDELHRLARRELGGQLGSRVFGYGIDLLPWENREVIAELILARRAWGSGLAQQARDRTAGLRPLLQRVPLFAACQEEELDQIGGALKPERFAAGEIIIRQGAAGDKFYIIERGIASIWVANQDGIEKQVNKLSRGQYFGEIALVANTPRTASVRAETPLWLLSLNQRDFDLLVKKYVTLASQLNKPLIQSWVLRSMPIFDELEGAELERLAARLQPEFYSGGEIIFRQGERGDKFYIVEAGRLKVMQEKDGHMIEISQCLPGEYAGEIALLQDRPRSATLVAAEDTTLLSLEAGEFHALVGRFGRLTETLERTSTRRLAQDGLPGAQGSPAITTPEA